jgi:2-keto-4-pentenoate hydratase/2-oxohepta-3-ene-1,7-dioic acid hydratase in catechol pathway
MKLVSYDREGQNHIGQLQDDLVHEFPASGYPLSMRELICAGPQAISELAAQLEKDDLPRYRLADVRLLAPLPDPGKVIGIGLNYLDHCKEANLPVPARPLVFAKFGNTITGPGQPVCYDPTLTQQVDYEVELGVVIGRRARYVSKEQALEYVFGYTALNDVSARDLQFSDGQWVRGKSIDTFCPIGPCILTSDQVPDPQVLKLRCSINGVTLQDSSTAEMIFGVAHLIADLSRAMTLEPGDLIATGTPSGVGMSRNPKVFLQHGDLLETEVEGIGRFQNPIRHISEPGNQ